jgi:tetratricopeptide (TPR) repeat protein
VAGRNLTYEEWAGVFGDRPYEKTCSNFPVHHSLRTAGLRFAEFVDLDEAVSLLTRAKMLGDQDVTDPTAMARAVAAEAELARGDQAAASGGYEPALAAYRRAVELGVELPQTPEHRAGSRAAQYYRDRAATFARENDAVRALAAFDRATALNSNIEIDYWQWARLCSSALIQAEFGIADRACASAIRISNDKVNYHDLLALTLAMNGRISDAETSFEAFFEFEKQPMRFRGDRRLPPVYVKKVKAWREAMRDGRIAEVAASLATDLSGRVSNF